MSRSHNSLSKFAAMLILMGVSAIVNAADSTRSFKFDISNQTLAQALRNFGHVSGQEVVFRDELVRNVRSVTLHGEYTAAVALDRLLEGTGLIARKAATGAITIVRSGEASVLQDPADQMRMAMAEEAKDADRDKSGKGEYEDSRQVTVRDRKVKPDFASNVDIPRTIDDVQPYYIFDAETIKRSGSSNVEAFLKSRLTMNTSAQANAQRSGQNVQGNISQIDLRGLGTDKTLVLVDGRRRAGVVIGTSQYQTDLNGIPLSAVERIEVLPSSASGIYGGSAIGGVINIITKKDFQGGEAVLRYDNNFDTDAPRRRADLSYGMGFEGGKTRVTFNASWNDSSPMLLQDRRDAVERNIAIIRGNDPAYFSSSFVPWLGSLPNISNTATLADFTTLAPLVLKNGNVSLNSPITYVPAGTSASTSAEQVRAALLANAGQWIIDLAPTTQSNTGLFRPFSTPTVGKSFRAGVRREMLPWLELFADLTYDANDSSSVSNSYSQLRLSRNSTLNPFTTDIYVRFPDKRDVPMDTSSVTRSATLGSVMRLPRDWMAEVEGSVSENRFSYQYNLLATIDIDAATLNGTLNPLVDTLQFPLPLDTYFLPFDYSGSSRMYSTAIRAAGPLFELPWGVPQLVAGLEARREVIPERREYSTSLNPLNSYYNRYYRRETDANSLYAELTVPLAKQGWLPAIHALELQVAGRGERYEADGGTPSEQVSYNRNPPVIFYNSPRLPSGAPFSDRTEYSSSHYTVGLKYQPISQLTLRVSRATAFLPPSANQLIETPVAPGQTNSVNDPQRGGIRVPVPLLATGGNPSLKPQHSVSSNAGLIWEPRQWLPNLRLNVEYYEIEQFDAISFLTAQQLVDQAGAFPGRVTRDANGVLTGVDTRTINLYHRVTSGIDVLGSYSFSTDHGNFGVLLAHTTILDLKSQFSRLTPEYDAVGYHPTEGGANRHKANATFNWDWNNFSASWTASYYGSYRMRGVEGSPSFLQQTGFFAGRPITQWTTPQGSGTVKAQSYHDVFVGYRFPSTNLLAGTNVQFGIRNIFEKLPPLDVAFESSYYFSSYGDLGLRSYWLNLTKGF